MLMQVDEICPMHPGHVLLYLFDYRWNVEDMAEEIGCDESELSKFLNGETDVTADFAVKLEYISGIHRKVWMRMQERYDNWVKSTGKREV